MPNIAEKFRYYANHPEYRPKHGLCEVLVRHNETALLQELGRYMRELGSSPSIHLQGVLDSEGWNITSKEVYLDWDNRPRIEDADTFKEGDKVRFHNMYGTVARVGTGLHCVKVIFDDGSRLSFTHNGRRLRNSPRELKHENNS